MMNKLIANVFCVGRNYRAHAEELGNDVPAEPMIFLKPSHAVTVMDGSGIALPADRGEVHYEAELVLRIGRGYEPGITVDELVDVMAFGIDLRCGTCKANLRRKAIPGRRRKGSSIPRRSRLTSPSPEPPKPRRRTSCCAKTGKSCSAATSAG